MRPHAQSGRKIRPFVTELTRLEDRLVPGETLGTSLLWAMGSFAYPALLGGANAGAQEYTPIVRADAAPAAAAADAADDDSGSLTVCQTADQPADRGDGAVAPAAAASATAAPAVASTVNEQVFADMAPAFDEAVLADPLPQSALPVFSATGTAVGLGGSIEAGVPLVHSAAPGNATPVLTGGAPVAATGVDSSAAMAASLAGDSGGTASPLLKARPTAAPAHARPNAANGAAPFSPSQIRHAYGFDQLANQGAGQTIYIVDAYNDPNIASDLQTFDSQWGLPNPSFTVHKMSSRIRNSASWGLEESLDVEWAHAVAPQANIVLVEAASNSNSNLYAAVDWATNQGAHVVSMSWGGGDSTGESSLDYHFNHSGVSYVASAGDSGGVVEYPSASPYVLSVGGTALTLDANNNYVSESAWSSGGGGASVGESEPGYQTAYGISLSGRGTPDVAYNGDPNTGVYVYDSYYNPPGWYEVGGTSAGAPQWAALIALANQSRSTPLSTNNLSSRTEYSAATGSVYGTNYHDVTTGSNGYAAGAGYDLATGVGSPQANNLVGWLISH